MMLKDRFLIWWMGVPKHVRTLIDYGTFLGVLNALFFYVMVLTPVGSIPFIGFLRLIFIALDVYFVYKLLKLSKEAKCGYVDQVIVGTVLLGVSGLVFGLFVLGLTNVVRPTLLDEQRTAIFASIDSQNLEEAKSKELKERYDAQLRQPAFSIDQFVGTTSNGLIYSMVVGIFVRYKKPKEENVVHV